MAFIDCPKCGHPISDRAPKCPNCGEKLKMNLIASSTNQPLRTERKNKPLKSSKHFRLFLYTLLGLVIAGVIGYYFYDRHHSSIIAERTALLDKGRNAYFNKQDYEFAFKCFLKAAEMGDPVAQDNVGVCYQNGYGVNINLEEAFKWFYKSARNGNPRGQYNLGFAYMCGIGTSESPTDAIKWLTKSAEGGERQAMIMLSGIYAGAGGFSSIEIDKAKSEYWIKQFAQISKTRAEAGDMVAQLDYGWCLLRGEGVVQNYDEGISWIEKSSKQGNPDATDFLIKEGVWVVLESDSCTVLQDSI